MGSVGLKMPANKQNSIALGKQWLRGLRKKPTKNSYHLVRDELRDGGLKPEDLGTTEQELIELHGKITK